SRPVAARLYRHVADSRSCSVHEPTGGSRPRDGFPRATGVVGTLLVVGNLVFGALKIRHGWPVARYPTFHSIATPEVASIEVDVARSSGEVPISLESLSTKLDSDVLRGLIGNLLHVEDPTERDLRLRSFWALCKRLEPALANVDRVLFYRVTLATDPELHRHNPLRRELLAELKVDGMAARPVGPRRSYSWSRSTALDAQRIGHDRPDACDSRRHSRLPARARSRRGLSCRAALRPARLLEVVLPRARRHVLVARHGRVEDGPGAQAPRQACD